MNIIIQKNCYGGEKIANHITTSKQLCNFIEKGFFITAIQRKRCFNENVKGITAEEIQESIRITNETDFVFSIKSNKISLFQKIIILIKRFYKHLTQ